jgi:hypothetical protein
MASVTVHKNGQEEELPIKQWSGEAKQAFGVWRDTTAAPCLVAIGLFEIARSKT